MMVVDDWTCNLEWIVSILEFESRCWQLKELTHNSQSSEYPWCHIFQHS
jgi:hypothetical protein